MKKNSEYLLNAIGAIDDELIKNAMPVPKRKAYGKYIRFGGMAAALALIAGAGIWYYQACILSPHNTPDGSRQYAADSTEPDSDSESYTDTNMLSSGGSEASSAADDTEPHADSTYVNIATLLTPPFPAGSGIVETQALRFMRPSILGVPAEYYQVSIHDDCTALLPQSIGTPLEGMENVYQIAGHDEFQYLISVDSDNNYELWEFHAFCINAGTSDGTGTGSKTYPYQKVLDDIYGIRSAADIVSITVNPATMNNSDAGKALQEKIGTHTVTAPSEIAVIYDALAGMHCYGDSHWDMIDLGDSDVPVDGRSPLTATENARYLTIETANGNTISSLKYTSYSDCFYEHGGVAYSRLSEEAAASIDRILGIQ